MSPPPDERRWGDPQRWLGVARGVRSRRWKHRDRAPERRSLDELAEAVHDVVDILRGQPASERHGPADWDRIVRIIGQAQQPPRQ